jgi:rubrerythrin
MKKWRIYLANDHDPHHDKDYRNWAEKAKANGCEEAGALFEKAAEMSLVVKDRYQKALGLFGDELKPGTPEVK